MSVWIYQLNQKNWPPETFRYEIWEGRNWSWGYGKKIGAAQPAAGDTLVFFYAPRGGKVPGIYGWAVVERCDEESRIVYFRPTAPTDHLKMDPWWDEEVKKVTEDIRGPVPQATLFQVQERNICKIQQGIKNWLSCGRKDVQKR